MRARACVHSFVPACIPSRRPSCLQGYECVQLKFWGFKDQGPLQGRRGAGEPSTGPAPSGWAAPRGRALRGGRLPGLDPAGGCTRGGGGGEGAGCRGPSSGRSPDDCARPRPGLGPRPHRRVLTARPATPCAGRRTHSTFRAIAGFRSAGGRSGRRGPRAPPYAAPPGVRRALPLPRPAPQGPAPRPGARAPVPLAATPSPHPTGLFLSAAHSALYVLCSGGT